MPLSREAPIGGCNSSLPRRYFHCYMQKRFSIGNKLYLSVVSLFLIFAVSFVVFQQYREKQYKVDTLNLRLQAFNNELHDAMQISGKGIDEAFINSFLLSHNDRLGNRGTTNDLRVTIILRNGKVVFDNVHNNYESMANHASRPEVKEALARVTALSLTAIAVHSTTIIFTAPLIFLKRAISFVRPCLIMLTLPVTCRRTNTTFGSRWQ